MVLEESRVSCSWSHANLTRSELCLPVKTRNGNRLEMVVHDGKGISEESDQGQLGHVELALLAKVTVPKTGSGAELRR